MFDYEDIIDALETGEAVLFVGPRLLLGEDDQPLEQHLHRALKVDEQNHPLIRTFYGDEGFFLLHEESYRRRLTRQIRKFYEEDHPTSQRTLEKLARIPFPLVISLNADGLLQKAFETAGQPYHQDFYYRNQPYQDYVAGTPERPLLYGMLGDLSKADSLVLTHKDLFKYLESVFAGKSMAPELRRQIQDARTFIFLGLPFEKWYMQLLLRVLYFISRKLGQIEQYASTPVGTEPHTIFSDEFKIQFVPDAGPAFVAELYQHCEREGLLRTPVNSDQPSEDKAQIQQARREFTQDKVPQAMETLRTVLRRHRPKTNTLYDRLDTLEQTYNHINRKMLQGSDQESDRAARIETIANCITLITETESLLDL